MSDDGFDETLAFARSRVGSVLNGKWSLERLLGVGGMASVYEATHRNRKRAAIKVLHRESSMNTAVRERFLREGYVANSVGHPGAVSVDDDDVSEDGCAFLVMELLDGETLDARWERKGKHLQPDEVLSLIDQVLSTLGAAHAAGVVHRDLKPENLFLTRAGVVKVLDFGIARVRELSQQSSKTQTGSTMGTPSFMPPEQARGRWDEVDARTDIWAIGATMFTLLTGRYVHEATTVNEALAFAVTQPARSVSTLLPELPFPVVELVDRALAYDMRERWPSAATMQTALRRAYAGLEAAALAAGEPRLKPITLETFDDATVAVAVGEPSGASPTSAGPIAIDSDIPLTPSPVARPGALTTARGVAHGAFEQVFRGDRRSLRLGLGTLVLGSAAIGAWIGLGHDRAPPSSPASQESPLGAPSVTATMKAPSASPRAPDEPSRVSLDQLPVAATPPEPFSRRLHAEVEGRRATVPSAAPLTSTRPLTPTRATAARPAPPSGDPFADRQ